MSNTNDFFDEHFSDDAYHPQRSRTGEQDQARKKKKNRRLVFAIIIDAVSVCVGLGIFSLFHFLLPHVSKSQPVKLPHTTQQADATPVSPAAEANGTEKAVAAGAWGEKFANKFSTGQVEQTDNSYKSQDINVKIDKVQKDDVTYYYADIYIRALENFKTAMASEPFATGKSAPTLDLAQKNKAIIAVSGDYFGMRQEGIVIRNGELFRDTLFQDVLIMNNDGSMETFTSDQFDIEAIKQNGAYQGWSFGPMLLEDGQTMDKFNSTVNPANPRCAIGYFEPGHYCFVLVDGRQPGYSKGLTTQQLSQLFYDKGCKTAYNLDGGQSAEMVFMGKIVNKPYNGGRDVSDIIYICER